ncbi:unnamed protein product [Protopolystoma xenopodis]|uniref:Serine/threonine-protein phosphatase 2A activator n=1 Tax=Protopolystoma xenopodis TaxID=117903 RepID=A0A448WUN5_9PLAT|nr:unnamed protein product [Protopolystoma xenopodis]
MKLLKAPTVGASNSGVSDPVDDLTGVGLVIMPEYLALVRRLQTFYRMEPAGSHGVWSLDDFQFVPFIWGSSQLYDHPSYGPSSIIDKSVSEREKNSYLFFSCIDYIHQVKIGLFQEHSSTLSSISELPHWHKVNSGLIKMYKGEVLDKFPVVQHFLFGELLTMSPCKLLVSRPSLSSRFASGIASLSSMPPPSLASTDKDFATHNPYEDIKND